MPGTNGGKAVNRRVADYAISVAVVGAAFALRYFLVLRLGAPLPAYIIFYPAVMLVAVLAGLGPGLLATALAALLADLLILPPVGHLFVTGLSDAAALLIFIAMGVFISLIAERHRRTLRSVALYKTEKALRLSEAQLRQASEYRQLAIEAADLGAWEYRLDSGEFSGDAQWRKILGFQPHEPVTLDAVTRRLHPDDILRVQDSFAQAIARADNSLWQETYRIVQPDGALRWLTTNGRPFFDGEGDQRRITRFIGVTRDVTGHKLGEARLHQSEERYRGLFSSMDEGFCLFEVLFDDSGRASDLLFLDVNAVFEKQTGLHDPVGHRVLELAPSLEQFWIDTYGRVALTGEPAHVINEAAPLGRIYEAHAYRIGESHQRHVAVVFTDITERKAAEQHIRRLNRVYAVLSDINQTIVRERDSQALLAAACRIAVEKGQFRMAWIGMVNPESHVLEPVASSGVVEDYLDRIRIDFSESTPDNGSAARCFFTGRHAISNDIEHELNRPWIGDALRLGYRSSASFPLLSKGKVVGIFTIYAVELAFFDEDEIKLLDEMAMDISFALEVNRHEIQRREAEQHVRHLNRVYAVLSGINETIVREKDSQALLQVACRIAVEKGEFRMAWIGRIDPETQVLVPVASSGQVDGYLDRLRIDLRDRTHFDGPAMHAVQSSAHAICNSIEHDPSYARWRKEALEHGFRSSAAFPLIIDGRVEGVFNLYAAEPGFFACDELSLLDEMARDIAFALEVIRHEADRRKKEEELRWRTAFFEAQIDSSLDGVLVVDAHNRKILQNQRMNDLMRIPDME